MPFEQWFPMMVGGITVLLVFIFKFFPSTVGAGERLLGWLCTHGPLWPMNRVIRARALGRSINPPLSYVDFDTLEVRLRTSLELWALLDPVIERHPTWFTHGYIDAKGVEHPYKHRFVEFRIAWCLFWRGASYAKFQAKRKEFERLGR